MRGVIKDEVDSLEILKKAGVKTVKVYHVEEQELISDVTCGQEQAEGCSGQSYRMVAPGEGLNTHTTESLSTG